MNLQDSVWSLIQEDSGLYQWSLEQAKKHADPMEQDRYDWWVRYYLEQAFLVWVHENRQVPYPT